MATIITQTPHGLAVTSLANRWEYDLPLLARDIGALSVSWSDASQQGLTVIYPAGISGEDKDLVLIRLTDVLSNQGVYSRRQQVEFAALGPGMVLVQFASGLPDGDHIGYQACHYAIDDIVYGTRNMVLVRANNVSDAEWEDGVRKVWSRLRMNGITLHGVDSLPVFGQLPWVQRPSTGQMIMVDPGLAVVETYERVRPDFEPQDIAHEAVPVVVGSGKYFVFAAGDGWPNAERTVLSNNGVRFLVEIGRAGHTLAAQGYLDIDAPLTIL